jgi:predicted adenine nucleotide alpha hydrolase (AANH) superfamily ATPase
MKLLFHCCCGPCTLSCLDSLKKLVAANDEFKLFWYNPNIHPYTEYRARKNTFTQFAEKENLNNLIVDEYGLQFFLEAVSSDTQNRCEKCYRIRLGKTAETAARTGMDAFSTSLLVSPYQDHNAIRRVGEEVASRYNIAFLYHDFRAFFREGQVKAKARDMYMQKYCGCVFSEEERYLKTKPEGNKAGVKGNAQ